MNENSNRVKCTINETTNTFIGNYYEMTKVVRRRTWQRSQAD